MIRTEPAMQSKPCRYSAPMSNGYVVELNLKPVPVELIIA